MKSGTAKEGSPPSRSFFSDFAIAIFASERDWMGHGIAFGAACLVEYSEFAMEVLNTSALLKANRSLDCHKSYKVPDVGRDL